MTKPALTTYDYAALKEMARELGRPVGSLYVLASNRDPFYAGSPARRARAEWFAALWERFGFRQGVHLRRIHYKLISQEEPVRCLNGVPYKNTERCWDMLGEASLDARYLGFVPIDAFVDRRNAEPIINLPSEAASSARLICTDTGAIEMPEAPTLHLVEPTIPQRFHVELWAEKTTVNDVLEPLAQRYGLNLITGAGEQSATACRDVIGRAIESGKPVRILYLSDFDPGGMSMPVAAARKVDFLRLRRKPELDIQLRPIALTHEQCLLHHLPRTPIKETERRAGSFEQRYGEGATELDALEALYPGELRHIVEREVSRYIDPTLKARIAVAAVEARKQIEEINLAVLESFGPQLVELRAKVEALEEEKAALFAEIEKEARQRAADVLGAVGGIDWPEPREGDEDPNPLFDSRRGYVEQVDRFKRHQDKPTGRRGCKDGGTA